jgi:predicted RNA binding protein YcfA (HicA-like mRNA interferase family)
MAINYSQLGSLTARRLIRTLKKDGFYEFRRKGQTAFLRIQMDEQQPFIFTK